jgi:CO dehydrogenase maturation factor
MAELPNQDSREITVLDMEASIEHLTRGTVRNTDVLLVITEPYYRSLETTGRVVPLAQQLGLERVWVVANKVRADRDEAAIREYCARRNFEVVGVVPFDDNVTEADHEGHALIDHAPESAAVVAIEALADVVMDRAGLPSETRSPRGG